MKIKEVQLLSSKIEVAIDKIWKVSLFGPDNYKSAVISHYLRTKKRSYKKNAIEYASDLLEGYLDEEITSKVAEDALQILIGFEDDILFPKLIFLLTPAIEKGWQGNPPHSTSNFLGIHSLV